MINPNKVKGVASKLESLVSYPTQKQVKHRKRNKDDRLDRKNLSSICLEENTCIEDIDIDIVHAIGNPDPTLKDFIDVVKQNNVLEDTKLSKQLLFLMNCFITMKKNETKY